MRVLADASGEQQARPLLSSPSPNPSPNPNPNPSPTPNQARLLEEPTPTPSPTPKQARLLEERASMESGPALNRFQYRR